MSRFDFEAACDPVGDGPEVLEPSVAAGPPACKLELAVDGFDGGCHGVVSEVTACKSSVQIACRTGTAFDTQTNRLSQRIHFEKSINEDLIRRAVYGTRKTDQSDYDYGFFQAELFRELSDDTDYLRTGFRFDLHLVDDDRPNFLGVNWMSQINLIETWSCRVLAMSSFDFGENARDGVCLQARASVTCHVTEHLSLGAELYDSYGSTDHLLRFADQNFQLGPIANYTFDSNFRALRRG